MANYIENKLSREARLTRADSDLPRLSPLHSRWLEEPGGKAG